MLREENNEPYTVCEARCLDCWNVMFPWETLVEILFHIRLKTQPPDLRKSSLPAPTFFTLSGIGDFADFSAFADFIQCFQSFAFLRISAVPSFNQREREMRKKCLQNNPNRASERNAEKLLTKISLTEPQLCEPLNCERHGQCTLSFC